MHTFTRIKTLSDPSHRFKVRKNAEQMGLTGLCVFNPSFALVIVEGSSKAIKSYDRLMLVRIKWTEAAQARTDEYYDEEEEGEGGSNETRNRNAKQEGEEDVVSLEDNKCEKIWQGPLRDRTFTTFKARSCPTDTSAKEALGGKWSSYWDAAKAFIAEDVI